MEGKEGRKGRCFLSTHRYAYRSCPCADYYIGTKPTVRIRGSEGRWGRADRAAGSRWRCGGAGCCRGGRCRSPRRSPPAAMLLAALPGGGARGVRSVRDARYEPAWWWCAVRCSRVGAVRCSRRCAVRCGRRCAVRSGRCCAVWSALRSAVRSALHRATRLTLRYAVWSRCSQLWWWWWWCCCCCCWLCWWCYCRRHRSSAAAACCLRSLLLAGMPLAERPAGAMFWCDSTKTGTSRPTLLRCVRPSHCPVLHLPRPSDHATRGLSSTPCWRPPAW